MGIMLAGGPSPHQLRECSGFARGLLRKRQGFSLVCVLPTLRLLSHEFSCFEFVFLCLGGQ